MYNDLLNIYTKLRDRIWSKFTNRHLVFQVHVITGFMWRRGSCRGCKLNMDTECASLCMGNAAPAAGHDVTHRHYLPPHPRIPWHPSCGNPQRSSLSGFSLARPPSSVPSELVFCSRRYWNCCPLRAPVGYMFLLQSTSLLHKIIVRLLMDWQKHLWFVWLHFWIGI